MLYLIPTPIGNLADITYRAVDTLKICDYILCEDTRHSAKLLSHYQITKPLKSFFKFNELYRESEIIEDLRNGLQIGLISDAGTPGISDPGTKLVQKCIELDLPVTALPGPCAAITALSSSGMDTDVFQFHGFLPKKTGERKKVLQTLLAYPGTTICYESPMRLVDTLKILNHIDPERPLAVARELTKKFEEIARGTASRLLEKWLDKTCKGEIILLISGQKNLSGENWESLTPIEHVEMIQQMYSLDRLEAIKMTAKIRGTSKREIYNIIAKSKS